MTSTTTQDVIDLIARLMSQLAAVTTQNLQLQDMLRATLAELERVRSGKAETIQ